MVVASDKLVFSTRTDHEYIDLTAEVERFVKKIGVGEGIVNVATQHTTTAVVVQEADPHMHEDTAAALLRLLPLELQYKHMEEGNLNATAHIKAQLLGNSVTVPVRQGRLALGAWQRIFFIELFEPRQRKVLLTVMGE